MKKFITGLFLVVSTTFIGFAIGGTIAKYFFVHPGDGLAGAGTAAILALFGAFIGLIISIVLTWKLPENQRTVFSGVATVIAFILWLVMFFHFKERQKEKEKENQELFGTSDPSTKVTQEAASPAEPVLSPTATAVAGDESPDMGVGMVSIQPENGKVLRFYSKPEHFELPEQLTAVDSITFKEAPRFVDIATAPPWFLPENMKLDYNILQLKAVTANRNWVEVIVNKMDGTTLWVYKEEVNFQTWPEFMINVYSVDLLNPMDFPPRIKPMDHASPASNVDPKGDFHPISIKDDWMEVHPDHEIDSPVWIRWRRDGRLMVSYSLLS